MFSDYEEKVPELAWAAGFFDGEGSTFLSRQKVVHYDRPGRPAYRANSPSLSIAQVDRRPLDRWVAVIGVGTVRGPYKPRTKNSRSYYRVELRGRIRSHRALVQMWPYMSKPKKEQAHHVWAEAEGLRTKKSPPLPRLPEY